MRIGRRGMYSAGQWLMLFGGGFLMLGCQSMERASEPLPTQPAQCALKPETGKCKAAFRYYFFNPASGQCEQYIYGGCGAEVPFKTLEACQQMCEH